MAEFRNYLSLDNSHAELLEKEYNILLANYRVAYMNTHGFHWMIQGQAFYPLHNILGDLYQNQIQSIDVVAERMLSLGLRPIQTYQEVLTLSEIHEQKDVSDSMKIAQLVVGDLTTILQSHKRVREIADKIGDSGSVNQMEEDIQQTEKKIWMWSSYIG